MPSHCMGVHRIQTLSDLVCGHGPNQDRVCSFDEGQGLEMLLQLADRSCLEAIDCCRWLSLVAMVADSNSTNQEALVDLKTVQKAMEVGNYITTHLTGWLLAYFTCPFGLLHVCICA